MGIFQSYIWHRVWVNDTFCRGENEIIIFTRESFFTSLC